jgi:hypothetical protein
VEDPNYDYTKDEIKKNLILLEGHGRSNPCPDCVEKHLFAIEGLSEEGASMAEEENRRSSMLALADWSRAIRKNLDRIV